MTKKKQKFNPHFMAITLRRCAHCVLNRLRSTRNVEKKAEKLKSKLNVSNTHYGYIDDTHNFVPFFNNGISCISETNGSLYINEYSIFYASMRNGSNERREFCIFQRKNKLTTGICWSNSVIIKKSEFFFTLNQTNSSKMIVSHTFYSCAYFFCFDPKKAKKNE